MEPIVVRPTEAAKMLMMSMVKIYELLESGTLPAYRDGRNWSIPVRHIHEYAESRALEESERRRNVK